MVFVKYKRAAFYKTLLSLCKRNVARSSDASFRKVQVGSKKYIYSYVRQKNGKKVFVILNLSTKEQTISVNDQSLQGNPYNLFMGKHELLTDKP